MSVAGVAPILAGLLLAGVSCTPAGADRGPATDGEQAPVTDTAEPGVDPDPADAAGPDDPGTAGNAAAPVAPATEPDQRPEGAPADTIVLTSRGPELAFHPDRVSARSGSSVLIRYENGGELPHNLVFVRDEEAIDALVTAAYEAGSTGHVPLDMRDDLIAFSPLMSPGETAEMQVVIPPPGEYTYICLFPGHAQMMLGTLRSLP